MVGIFLYLKAGNRGRPVQLAHQFQKRMPHEIGDECSMNLKTDAYEIKKTGLRVNIRY
ncbi:MAG: hypothetical protein ACOC4B_01945 [Bacteroidota bacterium]